MTAVLGKAITLSNMKKNERAKTNKIIMKGIGGAVVCTVLFLVTVLVTNAATSTVQYGDSPVFTPRYLPNIIQGAKGPADMIFFLYKYLMGLVGIVAVGTIIYAGVLYTISADPSKIKQSNEYIRNALKGIVLLFGAQVLFNTINPNIVDFPRIQSALQPKQKFVPNAFTFTNIGLQQDASTTAITAAKDRQGAINLYGGLPGTEVLAGKIQACNDCASPNFGGGATFRVKQGACFGAGCQINKGLINTLNNLQTIASGSGVQWQMTEGYPPTVDHQSSCHFNGTCVDIGLTGDKSAAQVNAFISAAKKAGLTVVNEYSVGDNPQHFDTTKGGHLHVHL